jgi:hypothetical protein
MDVPAGWYPAADGSYRLQHWDGAAWTEFYSEPVGEYIAQFPRTVRDEAKRQAKAAAKGGTSGPVAGESPEVGPKINFFNGSKVARELAEENRRLGRLIEEHGLLEVAELDALKVRYQGEIDAATAELNAVRTLVTDERKLLSELQSTVLDVRNAQSMQEFGLYDFEHPAESSVSLATELEGARSQIKAMVQVRTATTATANFTFNNSAAKGAKFVKDMSAILLRAYNAEAENCVKTVRAGNLTGTTLESSGADCSPGLNDLA